MVTATSAVLVSPIGVSPVVIPVLLSTQLSSTLGGKLAVVLSGIVFMQKEGTNSAALTFNVENLPSINLLSAAVVSPLSACCSHESGATLFAIFISDFNVIRCTVTFLFTIMGIVGVLVVGVLRLCGGEGDF